MKSVKTMSLVMLLALVLMGAAYAVWAEDITINGNVQTGYLDTVFTAATSNDPGVSVDPGKTLNVGRTEVPTVIGADGVKDIGVDVTNAYPGYNATVNYTIKNNGTIPVKVTEVIDKSGNEAELSLASTLTPNTVIAAGATYNASIAHTLTDAAQQEQNYHYKVTITATQAQ
ncbi:MAG: hypothetical protein A4E52_00554 [Pelotomaculum sp. PtaB.Bin013]|uniref:CARDB domain-containing protein n=1 Tax=Pelotomaculum isophthalicicum JI TaxID=947010 RepID=A0A9X4GZP7_9FIRM|nr:CARDB domain-containing protein [Pelotomaculum isophthalicicum]MDF9409005.1 hypothetical protein [Pelotomaculum isophthalicicum JI]OPX91252.1 MAG: hypothetical protein A4E52_00554 [Pelotomaculum sp. PtaB.Bin013]